MFKQNLRMSDPDTRLPLRVLAVSSLYPTKDLPFGGIFIHRMHKEFHRYGAEVVVAQTADWTPGALSSLIPDAAWRRAWQRRGTLFDSLDGVPIVHPVVFAPRPSRFFTRRTAFERTVDALERWVHASRWRPDVLLGHFAVIDGAHAVELGKRLRLPVAVMTWGDDIHAWPEVKADWAAVLRQVLAQADLLIACSRQMAYDAEKWGAPTERWSVVYGGVDTDVFQPRNEVGDSVAYRLPAGWGRGTGRRVLLCVARVERAKGHEELLAAFARCAADHPEWDLLLAGAQGDGTIQIEQLIERWRLTGRVRWVGPVNPEPLPGLYRAADAFVLPSHREGLSIALLEALASGLPAVTTSVGGHPEVVDPNAGWLVQLNDVDSLERALRQLMRGAGPATPAGARRAALRVGSTKDNTGRLVELLSAVASQHKADESVRIGTPRYRRRFQ
jgi:glycosyltransferase involved in cell wall biosynthesis